MRIQLLSDLHLETETFTPEPAPDAEVLVLAGDIDSTWAGLSHFADWPVPVLMVAGNHEFDRRELADAWAGLHERCAALGLILLEHRDIVLTGDDGRRVRFLGTVRWSDFDLFGPAERPRAMRAASYFQKVQQSTVNGGQPFDAAAVREAGLADRAWLADALRPTAAPPPWDAQVVITHFAPSLRSADPRFGRQPGTASFCNADDDLLPLADLWLHGHVHCRHDHTVPRTAGMTPTRVVCNARGMVRKGEATGFEALRTLRV
ncbi:phosphoesterase [Vitreoscilla filiformis]|uniref:Phosphoesterase n=1 Tax=Vitreoscilla filiformis TaxID=63 RepID=A0A221KC91_VITFI|nr:metallophosphoesterase [Vitreoscilla filiformis]ASM76595.1 phosphoesterase [Vitreoscilla filiformis]